jgi:uncharacterized membrane protein YraQ (UPF0718 family)
MDILLRIGAETWSILLDAAPFVLFGFLVAGLLKMFLPADFVLKHLGKKSVSSVFKAAAIGAPIPLCSCGVVPAAAGMRKQGASKGATAAFLISTPETGVDSIAVTYALLDPIMAVVRPMAGVLTAIVAGLGVHFFDKEAPRPLAQFSDIAHPLATFDCGADCGCGASASEKSWRERIMQGASYAFVELVQDVGGWLLLGLVLGGAIMALLPAGFLESQAGGGILPMLAMLLVSVPLYTCATSSTPIAAALALKGLSPGAALVFLLAGPATNVATITVVARLLGKRAAGIYLSAIVVCSLAMGLGVNWLYAALGRTVSGWVASGAGESHGLVAYVSAVLLLGLYGYAVLRRRFHGEHEHGHCGCSGRAHETQQCACGR